MKSSPNVRQNQVSNWLQIFSTKDANSGLVSQPSAAKGLPCGNALVVPQGFLQGSLHH